jgi:ACS family hexuronate transporter-like MFS transporter
MSQAIGKYRWTICALVFFRYNNQLLDRAVISLLKEYLEKDFSWSETDYGNLVIAFNHFLMLSDC